MYHFSGSGPISHHCDTKNMCPKEGRRHQPDIERAARPRSCKAHITLILLPGLVDRLREHEEECGRGRGESAVSCVESSWGDAGPPVWCARTVRRYHLLPLPCFPCASHAEGLSLGSSLWGPWVLGMELGSIPSSMLLCLFMVPPLDVMLTLLSPLSSAPYRDELGRMRQNMNYG